MISKGDLKILLQLLTSLPAKDNHDQERRKALDSSLEYLAKMLNLKQK